MSENKTIPAIEGLFVQTPQGPRLCGSRCATCKSPYFPRSEICHNPGCDASKIEDDTFGPGGVIWSYAVQNFPPPAPAKFTEPYQPYAVGMIDLDDGLRVLGRIIADDPESVPVGGRVELVIEELYRDGDGKSVVTWMFKPL